MLSRISLNRFLIMKKIITILVAIVSVHILSAQNAQMVIPFDNSKNIIRDVVLSPDNKYIATCFQDNLILISESNTGKLILRLEGLKIEFSPNNKYFILGGENGSYQLYDFKSGKALFEPWSSGTRFPILMKFSPESDELITNFSHEIVVYSISEKKIKKRVLREKSDFAKIKNKLIQFGGVTNEDLMELYDAVYFDSSGSTIMVKHGATLDLYNSRSLKFIKTLDFSTGISKINSVVKLDSVIYVVGELGIEGGEEGVLTSRFMKCILDEKMNISSSKIILECNVGGYYKDELGLNWDNYYMYKIKLINDNIALFKSFDYNNGVQEARATVVDIYSLILDSCLFSLHPERSSLDYDDIQDVSNDLTYAAIINGYNSYSKRIIHREDTLYVVGGDEEFKEVFYKSVGFLDNSKINYVEEVAGASNILTNNSLVNITDNSLRSLYYDFETSPKLVSLQDTLNVVYQAEPALHLMSKKGDTTYVFDANGFVKFRLRGEFICHDYENKKSVFYSNEDGVQIYDAVSNSVIYKLLNQQFLGSQIDAALSFSNKLIAISPHDWSNDSTRTVYVYSVVSGTLLKTLVFSTPYWVGGLSFDNLGKKLCLNYAFKGGFEVRDWEKDSLICKGDDRSCHFLDGNKTFYLYGFDSRDSYTFTLGASDSCFSNQYFKKSLSFYPSVSSIGGINHSIGESSKTILLAGIDNSIVKVKSSSLNFGNDDELDVETIEMPSFIERANYIKEEEFILAEDVYGRYYLIDDKTNKLLYTLLFLPNQNWLIYDEHYRFDGTPGAIDKLYFVCGLEVIDLAQLKDELWVPGLAEKIINNQDILINDKLAPKLSELNICELTPVIEPIEQDDKRMLKYRITPRKGGLGTTEVYINSNLTYSFEPSQLESITEQGQLVYYLNIGTDSIQQFLAGDINSVHPVLVKAKAKGSGIYSRGETAIVVQTEPKTSPRFYGIFIGVNDYGNPKREDSDLRYRDLLYAAKDARSLSTAVSKTAENLFHQDCHIYNLTGTGAEAPTKENLRSVLDDIGKQAKASDVLYIFFAGHGDIIDSSGYKQIRFMLQQADKTNPKSASFGVEELSKWCHPQNIKAQKRVFVFDACHSGQIIKETNNFRGDDEGLRIRQLDKLKDKNGMMILAASADDESAYEDETLEQGVLTYHLLQVMTEQPNDTMLQVRKWFDETIEEVKDYSRINGNEQEPSSFGDGYFEIGNVNTEVREAIKITCPKTRVGTCVFVAQGQAKQQFPNVKQRVNEYFASKGRGDQLIYSRNTDKAYRTEGLYLQIKDETQVTYDLYRGEELAKSGIELPLRKYNNEDDLVQAIVTSIALEIEALSKQDERCKLMSK